MNFVRLFLTALAFLTIIPVRIRRPSFMELSRSVMFFPLVGLIIGLLLAGTGYALSFILFDPIVKVILLIMILIITGGLHMDGLTDTVDAIASGQEREGMLRVMKESTIGPMGAAALILCLALKYGVLYQLHPNRLYLVLLFFPMLGRFAIVTACRMFPYARDKGTAEAFTKQKDPYMFMIVLVFSLVLSFFILQIRGIIIFGAVMLVTILTGRYFTKRIGGITGDVLGLINELGELTVLVGTVTAV